MDVAEGKESPRPAEPEWTFQRDGVRLAAERTSRLATRKELEAEGTAGMDDRRNDGRGARMASEGAGHGRRLRRQSAKLEVRSLNAERFSSPIDQAADARSRGFAQRTQRPAEPPPAQAKEASGEAPKCEVGRVKCESPNHVPTRKTSERWPERGGRANTNDSPQREQQKEKIPA
jgi:hypothetical protein